MQLDEKGKQTCQEIEELKKTRKAIILAHLYQKPEVQEVADYVADSLELSRIAAETEAEVIVFCGVHFMAESASILSPEKTVLLPEIKAGCPMADMVTAEALREKKKELPNAVVVAYVNTSAAVKAESDICCTSANAVKVLQSIPADKEILFVPDCNLGRYAAEQSNRKVNFWAGYCPVHNEVTPEDVKQAKASYPAAPLLVHPECRPEVVAMADCVASTSGMLKFVRENAANEFIVGTEEGLLYQLRKQNPAKKFHLLHEKLYCQDMKLTRLDNLLSCLQEMKNEVAVPSAIREKALQSLERMIAVF